MPQDITLDELARVFSGGRDVARSIYSQESSYGKNAGMSVDRAYGPMQVIEPTFNRFAQPGENWKDPRANFNVGQRMVDTFALKYGGDPGRVATAYFSGEGNVASPGSPTPFKRNASDSGGTTTAAYVGSVIKRLSPAPAQAADLSFDAAVDDFLNTRAPGQQPTPMSPPAGGTDAPLTFDGALDHYLNTLAPEAAAPSTAQSDAVATPAGPQPLPDEAIPPSADNGLISGAFAPVDRLASLSRAAGGMMNTYSAVAQGVTSTTNQQEPLGTVAVDDGGRTIIDPGQGQGWLAFDPKKHTVFRGPDGQPTAYPRKPQYEEGSLGRLGRLLGAGMIWGDKSLPTMGAAPVKETSAPVGHWSTRQTRDAAGRWAKKS